MASNSKKRRSAPVVLEENPGKRIKLASTNAPPTHTLHPTDKEPTAIVASASQAKALPAKDEGSRQQKRKSRESSNLARKRPKIHKLAAPRPFPAVAASAPATGPRSAHKEGKNYICLTRKTSLSAYMRRCKNLVINDGYGCSQLFSSTI